MSLTIDSRPTAGARRATPEPIERERRAPARRPARGGGTAMSRASARRGRPLGRMTRLLALHPGGAGFFALVTIGLSVLGLLYISQISHVARAGYTLSSLQDQQAKVERDNDVLQYKIDGQRTLARAAELAAGEYKMQTVNPHIVGTATSYMPSKPVVATTGATPPPQTRFITVPRPVTTVTPPESAPPTPSLYARVRDRLVGIGVARVAAR